MAHWAKLNENNIVVDVTVGSNIHLLGGTPLRKNYAGIGYTYDPVRDAFIPPKPDGEGWVLNEDTCLWEETIDPEETPYI